MALVLFLNICHAQADTQLPLDKLQGDRLRGEILFNQPRVSLCLLCHTQDKNPIAPSLLGVGSRLTPAQIRFRIIDNRRVNPQTLMPPFYSLEGLINLNARFATQTILTAQQIEDLVAYLASLK